MTKEVAACSHSKKVQDGSWRSIESNIFHTEVRGTSRVAARCAQLPFDREDCRGVQRGIGVSAGERGERHLEIVGELVARRVRGAELVLWQLYGRCEPF